jgi:hypothetical protein
VITTYTINKDQRTALLGYREWARTQPLCGEGYPWTEQLLRDMARSGSQWAGSWHLIQQVRNTNQITDLWFGGLDFWLNSNATANV